MDEKGVEKKEGSVVEWMEDVDGKGSIETNDGYEIVLEDKRVFILPMR